MDAATRTDPATPETAGDAEDARILQRARRGDTAAFETLYRANVGRVYALCLRMAGNAHQAEELTQAVFIRAWEKLWTFRGNSAFSTWLHRLAVNVVLTERRARMRREARVMLAEDVAVFERPPRAPQTGHRLDLDAAMAQLPEGARTVFVLHDIEGYRHREIAEMMGVTDGASKAQLHRARKLLRKALDQ